MLKNILFVPIVTVLVLAFYYSELIYAADTGSVAATVTVQNIAVTVSDGTIAYGILGVDSTKTTVELTDTQRVTNSGNVTSNVNIRGQDSAPWTLTATAGADQYVHAFCTGTCTTFPTDYTPLTTSYATLTTGLAASGFVDVELGINTPTTSTSYDSQNVNVTVQVVLP